MINKNFNINEVIKFTDDVSNNYKKIHTYNYINNNHNHTEYTILEDIYDTPLQYCNECDSIIKQNVKINEKNLCNDCISNKCKCLFC